MSAARPSQQALQILTDFITLYEHSPALWNNRDPLYKKVEERNRAYDLLVAKLRELDPGANVREVKRRINLYRTNYNREHRRIQMYSSTGKTYKTSLWYFELFQFLHKARSHGSKNANSAREKCILPSARSRKARKQGMCITKRDEESHEEDENDLEMESVQCAEEEMEGVGAVDQEDGYEAIEIAPAPHYYDADTFHQEFRQKFKIDSRGYAELHNVDDDDPDDVEEYEVIEERIAEAEDHQNPIYLVPRVKTERQIYDANVSETTEILAKAWAVQYEQLPEDQKVHACKAIGDILYEAKLGRLGPKAT